MEIDAVGPARVRVGAWVKWGAAGLVALALAGCASLLDRSTADQEKARTLETQLQLRVMRYADGYMDAVSRASSRVQTEATTSSLRLRLVDFQIKQSTAAVQIAAGPSPTINAVDMVVLASLTRASVTSNLPPIVGADKAQPVIETFKRLEIGAWALVDFLTPAQRTDLKRRLDAWAPEASTLDSVAFNRLADFARASGLPDDDPDQKNSILALIGADPLAGLNPALQEVQRSRVLAERAIYYAQRTPMLFDLQTRSMTAAMADMPEARAMVTTSSRVGESAALLAETAARMPEQFSREREAAIRQLLTAMEQQQGSMRQLLSDVKLSLQAGQGASDSLQGVLAQVNTLMERLKVGEPAPPDQVPGRPFDITEYARTAEAFTGTTRELANLLAQVDRDSEAAARFGDAMRGHAERLIDHLFMRVVQAFALLFGGVLLLVFASRLFGVYLGRRKEAALAAAARAADVSESPDSPSEDPESTPTGSGGASRPTGLRRLRALGGTRRRP